MRRESPQPQEPFGPWLLRRVARAVEAGEVPADLLAALQAEFEIARKGPQEDALAASIQHIVDLASVLEAEARRVLGAIDSQPSLTQKLLG